MSSDITPFRIDIPPTDVDDLHDRLARTQWADQLPGEAWSRGVPVDYLRDWAEYWRTGYSWREQEAALNELPQYQIEIDGHDVHFVHVRSPAPDALPLILTHGWPNSFVEFTKLIPRLADPRRHGADPARAFHVVVPSVPGFGFSTAPRETGWSVRRVAEMWAQLMERLGYDRYGTQGGDVGIVVVADVRRLRRRRVHVAARPERGADGRLRWRVGPDAATGRAAQHHRPLARGQPRQPLRRHGGSRCARRRHPRVLRQASVMCPLAAAQPPWLLPPPVSSSSMSFLQLVTIVVDEYDPAIEFFVDVLGFELVDDSPSVANDGRPKRWVVVRPPGAETGILLARADGDSQSAAVGNQVAGRVGFFLRVEDFDAARARMAAAGVRFVAEPRTEAYGRVAVFLDIAGNRWDLLGN